MPSELIPLATAATIGFLHAFDVDHLVAVTTFVSRRPTLGAAASFGLRWGLGHSIAVLIAGSLLLATGIHLPARYDAIAETLVGIMLVALGLWTLRSVRKLHLHAPEEHGGHAHLHIHTLDDRNHTHHHHYHNHTNPANHHHDHGGVTLVGLLHGLAGTGGVVALVPVTMMDRPTLGLGYLTLFGVGVTLAMMCFALTAAAAMRQANHRSLVWGRHITTMVGCAAVAVGIWWVATAIQA